jgi:hypothetical protein
MRYVILRDDDTNALTPVECLERLYRPFLDRGLPVNLAVIPDVATDARTPDGSPEGFLQVTAGHEPELVAHAATATGRARLPERAGPISNQSGAFGETRPTTVPIGNNQELVEYLRENSGYGIVQHGCHHDTFEFNRESSEEISTRLDHGTRLLMDAGFPRPQTFVAPHDKLSRASYREVVKRFRVLSTGWFELRRLPVTWWPQYVVKRTRHVPHWRVGPATLLSHPGCLLSCHRDYDTMLDGIIRSVNSRQLTVLVTHWWEYFRDGSVDERFVHLLHETAAYLGSQPDLKVISFSDLATNRVPLN